MTMRARGDGPQTLCISPNISFLPLPNMADYHVAPGIVANGRITDTHHCPGMDMVTVLRKTGQTTWQYNISRVENAPKVSA